MIISARETFCYFEINNKIRRGFLHKTSGFRIETYD